MWFECLKRVYLFWCGVILSSLQMCACSTQSASTATSNANVGLEFVISLIIIFFYLWAIILSVYVRSINKQHFNEYFNSVKLWWSSKRTAGLHFFGKGIDWHVFLSFFSSNDENIATFDRKSNKYSWVVFILFKIDLLFKKNDSASMTNLLRNPFSVVGTTNFVSIYYRFIIIACCFTCVTSCYCIKMHSDTNLLVYNSSNRLQHDRMTKFSLNQNLYLIVFAWIDSR